MPSNSGYILLAPDEPSFPVEEIPFVRWHKTDWDGGCFMDFADRHGALDRIPLNLREVQSDVPYMGAIDPAPRDEQQGFFQTWLFFGVLAEFYGINRQSGDVDEPDAAEMRRKRIERLYEEYTLENESGSFIVTSELFKPEVAQFLVGEVTSLAPDKISARLNFLGNCLKFGFFLIHREHVYLEHSVMLSICGLGELLNVAISTLVRSGGFMADVQLMP
jgi:hypothetical protein